MRNALAVTLFLASTFAVAANPIPLIYQPLSPASVAPGHAAFTLTLRGTNFVSGAVIKANGRALVTKFVNSTKVQTQVSASDVAKAGTASITVANPGSIDSNGIYFTVRQPSTSVTLTTDPATIEGGYLAVADFTNDHKPDIAVASFNVDIYQNVGKGNFNEIAGPPFGQNISQPPVMVADFNNDGNLDVAPCGADGGPDPSTCDIYYNDGKGNLTFGGYKQWVYPGVMADMNGDGILDSIATWGDGYQTYMSIYLGNGDGTFTFASTAVTSVYGAPVVGDFNGDGKLDVATSVEGHQEPGPGTVAVFLGNGDGTVQTEVDYTTPWGGEYAAVGDVNRDGKLDIIGSGFTVLLGNGDGTFTVSTSLGVRSWTTPIQLADINGDGKLDLVSPASDLQGNQYVDFLLGNGDGTFQAPIMFPVSSTNFLTFGVADFNGDGLLDVAINGTFQGSVLLQSASN
jgi:FG-GAP-like repeat